MMGAVTINAIKRIWVFQNIIIQKAVPKLGQLNLSLSFKVRNVFLKNLY